ncbi:MAG: HupE/UreJ family protein [Porticoccaceae bacterium]|nr:HupE/UreJ family protein [Porticoccaceae bacterium]
MSLRLFLTLWVLSIVTSAMADEARPVYVEITQTSPLNYLLKWKIPPVMASGKEPIISLKHADCKVTDGSFQSQQVLLGRQLYQCTQPNVSFKVHIDYPDGNPALTSLVVFTSLTSQPQQVFSGPELSIIPIGPKAVPASVVRQYTQAGVVHILVGIDHLLFVLCLMVIADNFKRLVLTVTGFTVAHSITLSLATLNIIEVRTELVETLIALSILLLAVEITNQRRSPSQKSFTWRHPVSVSSGFGLLHGFGFAVVLQDLGLPESMKIQALLFFNVGVEIGQILFIVAMLALYCGATQLSPYIATQRQRLIDLGIYSIGCCSAFWLLSRSVLLLP